MDHITAPFDTIIFACNHKGFPSYAWMEHMDALVQAGRLEKHHFEENSYWRKHTEGYCTMYLSADRNIMISIDPRWSGKMPNVRIKIQCGNLNLTATEVYAYIESILEELAEKAYVKEYHAKYDDVFHSFEWYRQRVWRKKCKGNARHNYETTVYFGNQNGDELRIYDKVKEAQKKGSIKPFSQLPQCTRIEKVVKYEREQGMNWISFLRFGIERKNPFELVYVGNIDVLDKRYQRVKKIGLHDYLRSLDDKRKRKELEALVFAQRPIDLAGEWYKRYDEWRKPFLMTLGQEELQQAA